MPLTKELDCRSCGNSCTVSYEESPYEEEITFCPFCGNDMTDDDLEYDEDEDEEY